MTFGLRRTNQESAFICQTVIDVRPSVRSYVRQTDDIMTVFRSQSSGIVK